ncbi:hypothetical protein D3C85_1366050 [compost metagenome]
MNAVQNHPVNEQRDYAQHQKYPTLTQRKECRGFDELGANGDHKSNERGKAQILRQRRPCRFDGQVRIFR